LRGPYVDCQRGGGVFAYPVQSYPGGGGQCKVQ
jgi:hypothetical protein